MLNSMTQQSNVQDFMWKDRKGNFHNPKDMKTSHVFFALRMIWNNIVDRKMQIQPVRIYNFGSFYTSEYMTQAVKVLLKELSTRNDLEPYFVRCLGTMQEHTSSLRRQYEII